METRSNAAGLSLSRVIPLATFVIGCITIWIHLEVRIAEINIEIVNLKQDLWQHKGDNRKDFEMLQQENRENTREILNRVDEIQIYLRNDKPAK